MPVPPINPKDTHVVIAVLIALGACLSVRYWGTALRIILIVLIAVAVYGAIVGFEGLTSLIARR